MPSYSCEHHSVVQDTAVHQLAMQLFQFLTIYFIQLSLVTQTTMSWLHCKPRTSQLLTSWVCSGVRHLVPLKMMRQSGGETGGFVRPSHPLWCLQQVPCLPRTALVLIIFVCEDIFVLIRWRSKRERVELSPRVQCGFVLCSVARITNIRPRTRDQEQSLNETTREVEIPQRQRSQLMGICQLVIHWRRCVQENLACFVLPFVEICWPWCLCCCKIWDQLKGRKCIYYGFFQYNVPFLYIPYPFFSSFCSVEAKQGYSNRQPMVYDLDCKDISDGPLQSTICVRFPWKIIKQYVLWCRECEKLVDH